MADPKESFPILVDGTTGAGASPTKKSAGDAAAGAVGSVAFAWRDSSGNVVLPQLDANGKVQVSAQQTASSYKTAKGENATGSLSAADVTGASITLAASKLITGIEVVGSCRQPSLFQLIKSDNAAETVLTEFIVGPGQYTFYAKLDNLSFTTGATGVQLLKFKANNFELLSSLRATINCIQGP